ncbi:MAG: hypothetical protein GEV07_09630 [Streptosporangiales bacterium]|nr:hypothetical protein [Streptosporangiales bacterium]
MQPTLDTPQRRVQLVGGGCLLAGGLVATAELVGQPDPVAMPTTPAWLTILAAVATAVLTLWPSRPVTRLRLGLVALGVAGMAAGSVLAVPHAVLMVVIWAANQVTRGGGSFEVEPGWLATTAHLAAMLAAVAATAWLVAAWRLRSGRCARCGRTAPEPTPPGDGTRRALRWLAAVAVLGALPYGMLKTAWSLGSQVGLVGHAFDDVGFASPGFGDTAVLTGISIVLCVVMGAGVRQRLVRVLTSLIAATGSMMLVPVSVVGLVMLGQAAFGLRTIDDTEIAPWAFTLVYVCFLVWGTALAALTVTYWRTTAGRCARHDR